MYGRYYRVMVMAYSVALLLSWKYYDIAFAIIAVFCMLEAMIRLTHEDTDLTEIFWFLWIGITIMLILRSGLFEWVRPITFVTTDVETYLLLTSKLRATLLYAAVVAGFASALLDQIKKPLY